MICAVGTVRRKLSKKLNKFYLLPSTNRNSSTQPLTDPNMQPVTQGVMLAEGFFTNQDGKREEGLMAWSPLWAYCKHTAIKGTLQQYCCVTVPELQASQSETVELHISVITTEWQFCRFSLYCTNRLQVNLNWFHVTFHIMTTGESTFLLLNIYSYTLWCMNHILRKPCLSIKIGIHSGAQNSQHVWNRLE